MLFTWEITIPAGTPDNAPITEMLELLSGIIESIEIKFLAGCHGLVKVRFSQGGSIITPSGASQYITGDAESVIAEINQQLMSSNAYLTFEGSSPDSDYEHTITLRIQLNTEFEGEEINNLVKVIAESLEVPP